MVTALTLVVFGATFTSSAFAECGPGFSSKSQLIQYYKHNPSAAHGFRKELLAHAAYTGYQADETVINYLRSSEQKVKNAHSGYRLKTNTYCPGGPGQYLPYQGLLDNMSGKPMLWHCPKGESCVPLLKGYCMNFVTGPPVRQHHPPKHHPHKCGCRKRHHRRHKPKIICKQGTVRNGNGCSPQTNNAEQECSVKGSNWKWNTVTQKCEIIQINANCSNVTVIEGSNNVVVQEGNCPTTVEEKPCGCHTPPPPPPPVEHWTEISCTGFEEISGGGSFLVDCGVSDDNGALISLEAHSNNGNSRVSGINCFSNGGSQTCPSGGTFEFRVSGINNGSSILSSSITATASANGVKATFTSDPFPVDPSEGGF